MQGTSLHSLIDSHGPQGFYHKVCELLNEKQISPDDFSYYELADACGVLPRLRSLQETVPGEGSLSSLLSESNPGVSSTLFQVVSGELIGRKVIEGYEDDSGFIGDRLAATMTSRIRNSKIAGFTALAGPTEVPEGHPYEESSFQEKYVTSLESKQGRILSINEELIAFDQTGEINRRATALGYYLRQERETDDCAGRDRCRLRQREVCLPPQWQRTDALQDRRFESKLGRQRKHDFDRLQHSRPPC